MVMRWFPPVAATPCLCATCPSPAHLRNMRVDDRRPQYPRGGYSRPRTRGKSLFSSPRSGDDDLDALELLELGVTGGRHRAAEGADQVHRPVGDAGGTEEDLLERADRADLDAFTAR